MNLKLLKDMLWYSIHFTLYQQIIDYMNAELKLQYTHTTYSNSTL